jgi:hypothetical protein
VPEDKAEEGVGSDNSSSENEESNEPLQQRTVQDWGKSLSEAMEDSPLSSQKKRRASHESKKSNRFSISSGFYTTDDEIPLDRLVKPPSHNLESPHSNQKAEAIAQKFAFASNSNSGSESKQSAPVMSNQSSSLIRSLDDTLESSDEESTPVVFDFGSRKHLNWRAKASEGVILDTSMETSNIETKPKEMRIPQTVEVIEID